MYKYVLGGFLVALAAGAALYLCGASMMSAICFYALVGNLAMLGVFALLETRLEEKDNAEEASYYVFPESSR